MFEQSVVIAGASVIDEGAVDVIEPEWRSGNRSVVASPGEADGGADIRQRPGRFQFNVKLAMHPERIRSATFEQRIHRNAQTDAECAQVNLAVELDAATDLQGRPLHRLDRRHERIHADAQRAKAPRVSITAPR